MKINEIIRPKEVTTESSGSGMMSAQAQFYKKGTKKKKQAQSQVENLLSGNPTPTKATGSLGPA